MEISFLGDFFLYIPCLIMINRLNKILAICNCIPILGVNL